MIRILDWIFEGIVGWISSITSQLLDAVSALFLDALGTDMTAMEEYFPFVTKAYDVMQYTAWAILFLIVMWQLFRSFGGPLTEAENPWQLTIRGALFALLIAYAKPIFNLTLTIAKTPYISLMEISMMSEDFTFAGLEATLTNGLTTIVSVASVVGLILILVMEISLGWNYFKLLLETVERYVVVGVMCYTSPLAFSLGGSKATGNVFKSWCRMVGSQLLLLVMNVWFLRGFASSVGQFIGNGGALTTGKGSIFLWMFCALAYLKCAQRFDSYLGSIGLNVAQTGSSMGMELLMAARAMTGFGGGPKSAGSVFGRSGGPVSGPGGAAAGFAAGFASKFSPNSYVRDAVVEGGTRMGMSGGAGFVARAFGGMAARNGATLNGTSISSVASRNGSGSGTIAGDIADRSLANYMPQFSGYQLTGTQITGGMISTLATDASGKSASVDLFNADQFEKPDVPHSVVTASDGSQWYQVASGEGKGAFYDAPIFHGTEGAATAEPVFTGASAAGAGDADQAPPHGSDGAEDQESDASEGFSTTGYQPDFTTAPTADMDSSGFSEPVTASEMGVVDQTASGNDPDYADGDVSNGFHPEITSMPTADMDSAEFSGNTGFETAAEGSMKSGPEDAFAERSADSGVSPVFTAAASTDASGFSNAVVSGSGAGADDGTISQHVPGAIGETYGSSHTGIPEDDGIHSEVAPISAATPDISGFPDTAAHFEPGTTGSHEDSNYPDSKVDSGLRPEFASASEVAPDVSGPFGTAAHFEPGTTGSHEDSNCPDSTVDSGLRPEFASASEVAPDVSGPFGTAAHFEPGMTGDQQDSDYTDNTAASGFHPEFVSASAAGSDISGFSGTAAQVEPGVTGVHDAAAYSDTTADSGCRPEFSSASGASSETSGFSGTFTHSEAGMPGSYDDSTHTDAATSSGFHPEFVPASAADAVMPGFSGTAAQVEPGVTGAHDAAAYSDTTADSGSRPEFVSVSAAGSETSGFSGTFTHSETGMSGSYDDSTHTDAATSSGFHPEFVPTSAAGIDTSGLSGAAAQFEPGVTGVHDAAAYSDTTADSGCRPEFASVSAAGSETSGFSGTFVHSESGIPEDYDDSTHTDAGTSFGFHPEFVPASAAGSDTSGFSGAAAQFEPGVTGVREDTNYSGSTSDSGYRSEFASASEAASDTSGFSGAAPRFESGVTGAHDDFVHSDTAADSGFNPEFAAKSEAALVAATFPGAPEGTTLRTVGEGTIEASMPDGSNSMWYNSAFYEEPDAPHQVLQSANGVGWFTMQPHAEMPQFEADGADTPFNQTAFKNFMPGYRDKVSQFDQSEMADGCFKVRNEDGSGTAFYDSTQFDAPRGSYKTFEDAQGSRWYAIRGEAAVDRKPVFEKGKPVYDGEKLLTRNVDTVRYKQVPAKFKAPARRNERPKKTPRRKNK